MIGYIYLTTNLINGKIYVGKRKLKKFSHYYKGSGTILREAFKKYGRENFSCILIDTAETNEELCTKEQYWIKYYNSRDPDIGYNITAGGEGSIGYKHSEEAKQKMHDAKIGKPLSPEWIEHREASRAGFKHSEETKQKISQANKGHKVSDETRKKLSKAGKGRTVSEETKQKLRESRAKVLADGTWVISESGRQKLRELGKQPKSEEHRKHLSESRINNQVAVGAKNPRAKAVYCFETNTVYSWAGEAAEALNVSVHMVRQVCQGKFESTKGYHFKWYILEK